MKKEEHALSKTILYDTMTDVSVKTMECPRQMQTTVDNDTGSGKNNVPFYMLVI